MQNNEAEPPAARVRGSSQRRPATPSYAFPLLAASKGSAFMEARYTFFLPAACIVGASAESLRRYAGATMPPPANMFIMSEAKLKEVAKIPARNTSAGARTYVYAILVESGDIRVLRTNFSRSERHWEDILFVTDDAKGVVYVADYSNSGKNNSFKLRIESGKVVAKEPWDPAVEKVPSGARITSPLSPGLRI